MLNVDRPTSVGLPTAPQLHDVLFHLSGLNVKICPRYYSGFLTASWNTEGFFFLLLTLTGGGAAEDAAAGGREPPGRGAAPSPSSWAHRTPDNMR